MTVFLEFKPKSSYLDVWIIQYANQKESLQRHNPVAMLFPTRVIVPLQDNRFKLYWADGQVALDISEEDTRIVEVSRPGQFRIIDVAQCECLTHAAIRHETSLARRRKRK